MGRHDDRGTRNINVKSRGGDEPDDLEDPSSTPMTMPRAMSEKPAFLSFLFVEG
ncbi:MAG: hypothetical protein M5R36_00040 [Deltaproteobacteria bacterium]|nr:hypothetical protein [Deltaproteobacteria bacterium]